MVEPSLLEGGLKKGNISQVIQQQARKISSPVVSDFLIAARRGFTDQVIQAIKEGGSARASSTDKVIGLWCLRYPSEGPVD
jgi:glycerol-3-phosphate responsive antiterminator